MTERTSGSLATGDQSAVMTRKAKRPAICKIEDDGLKPCFALEEVLEIYGVGTRYQGLKLQTLINMATGDFSRHLVVLKSGKHSKKGLVLNFCPFCTCELLAGQKDALDRARAEDSAQITSNADQPGT